MGGAKDHKVSARFEVGKLVYTVYSISGVAGLQLDTCKVYICRLSFLTGEHLGFTVWNDACVVSDTVRLIFTVVAESVHFHCSH